MAFFPPVGDAFKRLVQQFKAFRHIRALRGFRLRSHKNLPTIKHPDWQLILVVTVSLVALGFLFIDEAAGHWKSTISSDTYQFFREVTRLGKSEILLVPAALAVLALGLFPWHRLNNSLKATLCRLQLLGLYVFVAIAGSGITNNLIKIAVGRARPRHFEEFGVAHFAPPGLSSGFQSFPSGHSVTAGAMAIIFILLLPRYKWIWLAIAGWVATSRIVVGAHYPSDAVAGFVYGASFTWLLALWFVNRRLLFTVQDGLIRLPKRSGLSFSRLYKALHMMTQKP